MQNASRSIIAIQATAIRPRFLRGGSFSRLSLSGLQSSCGAPFLSVPCYFDRRNFFGLPRAILASAVVQSTSLVRQDNSYEIDIMSAGLPNLLVHID